MKIELHEDQYGTKCLYVEDYRISGRSSKPRSATKVIQTFEVDEADLKKVVDRAYWK